MERKCQSGTDREGVKAKEMEAKTWIKNEWRKREESEKGILAENLEEYNDKKNTTETEKDNIVRL